MNRKHPIVLCILDGWGIAKPNPGNAVHLAQTPCYDALSKQYPSCYLEASGKAIGLPDNQIGNSEVGHLHLGAGRVVYTGLTRINNVIKINKDENLSNSSKIRIDITDFLTEPGVKSLQESLLAAKESNPSFKLHLVGLFSKGGIHSYHNHVYGLIYWCHNLGIECYLHLFTDGRDVGPKSAYKDMEEFLTFIGDYNVKLGVLAGRYYAMDRDQNWSRSKEVFNAMVNGTAKQTFKNVLDYINKCYLEEITDEFIPPAVHEGNQSQIQENDFVCCFNFRPDRMKQLAHLFVGSIGKKTHGLYDEPGKLINNINLYTMMEYGGICSKETLFPLLNIENTFGTVIDSLGLRQLRIAETEKYPHVTYFFDGGKQLKLENKIECLINSPKVATYDLKPEMSAEEITVKLCAQLKQFDFVIVNYANPDMVGHSGKLMPTIKAVEVVDKQLGILYKSVNSLGGTMFIVADHGNSEQIFDVDETYWNSKEKVELNNLSPHTAHTTNKVQLIVTDSKVQLTVIKNASIASLSPTILEYSAIKVPKEMTAPSLLINKKSKIR